MLESRPTPQTTASPEPGLDVGDRRSAAAGGQGVLVVVEHRQFDADLAESVDEGVDRAVALAGHAPVLAFDQQLGHYLGHVGVVGSLGRHFGAHEPQAAVLGQVGLLEHLPELGGLDLGAARLGDRLHRSWRTRPATGGEGRGRARCP